MARKDYYELFSKDPNFYLRMGLRPDLHKLYYPNIPILKTKKKGFLDMISISLRRNLKLIIISLKNNKSKNVDPYKEIRKTLDPVLHKEYYPDEV